MTRFHQRKHQLNCEVLEGRQLLSAAKLNPATGLATWSDAGGGKGPDVAKSIAFDIPTGQVHIVGDYTPPAKFGLFTLGAKGAKNIYLASLK